jgi:predicted transposase/invertase (TIGR01784 family)
MKNEIISPMQDFVFAEVFGNKRNIGNTRAFLKTLLDIPEDDYDNLTVETPTLGKRFRKDKKGIVDLKLSTKSGRIIHIEIQGNKKTDMRSRILFYAAKLLWEQMKKGEAYEKLHQVISIIICDHRLLEEEQSYINVYELRNRENRCFTDLLQVIILELPKLPKTEDSRLWPWLCFFKCKREEEYDMLAKKYPELKKPVQSVKYMSLGENIRELMFRERLRKMDEQIEKKQILLEKQQARTEGRAEGQTESQLEIARRLKEKGLPLAEIIEITGLNPELAEKL